ncbi:hypothetical protein Aperf_G00000028374 [Anoplocephala perfoliata]
MIFRVRDPPSISASVAQPTSRKRSENQSAPSSESSEEDNESVVRVKIDPIQVAPRGRQGNLQPHVSYVESGENPFEEIVIRAETYFPSLTNIVRDPARSYIIEQTSFETQPPIQSSLQPSVPRPIAPPRRQLIGGSSEPRPNPFSASAAEAKRQAEEELDRRIMMYSRSNRNPHSFCGQHSSYGNPYQQGPPAMQYGGYCSQSQFNNHQQPYSTEPDMEERTTYDYRDFQAARQIFEQRSVMGPPVPPPMPQNHLHRLRLQNSITSTGKPSQNACNGGCAGPICPLNNAPKPAPRSQPTFDRQPSINQEGSTDPQDKSESRNLFNGGCGCGSEPSCGALPDTPIHRDQGNPGEAIKKYLISEEVGPGGVKSVFSFPGGMEPSDLTLLRAAISANQPKDAFIPEENDDLEEQLNRQLEKTCVDPRSIHMVHEQSPHQVQQHQQLHSQTRPSVYTVSRAVGPSMTGQPHQRPSISKSGARHSLDGSENGRTVNPFDTLLMNGITNNFVGPNSQTQAYGSATYPMCNHHHHQHQPHANVGNNVANIGNGSSTGGWHPPGPFQQPGFGGNYQTYTTYNSSRFDAIPIGGGGGGGRNPTQLPQSNTDGRFMNL